MLTGLNCDSGLALCYGKAGTFDLTPFGHDLLRFPGGGWANSYDWRTGWARPGYVGWADNIKGGLFDLDTLKAKFPPPQRILWTLNVSTDSLASQLSFLAAAQARGYAIEYVELGNELQFDASTKQNWPDMAAFAADMARWTRQIKSQFPGVQVAVCGASNTFVSPDWNKALLNGPWDAIAVHLYSNSWGHSGDANFALADWKRQFNLLAQQIPSAMPLWVTEYGAFDINWATGVYGPQQGTQMQATIQKNILHATTGIPQIKMMVLHGLCGIGSGHFGLFNGVDAEPWNALSRMGQWALT